MSRFFSVIAVGLLLLGVVGSAQTDAKDWPLYLATRDFAVEGHVLAVVDTLFVPQGTCGEGLSPRRKRQVTLRVSSVLCGVAPDTICAIRVPPANDGLRAGELVVAWGYYECADAFRLHGGVVQFPDARSREALISNMQEMRDLAPSAPFEHFTAACLVRVRGFRKTDDSHYPIFLVDGLKWEIGAGKDYPNEVEFHNPATGNCALIEVGDSLLVPVMRGHEDKEIYFCCPDYCAIRGGRLQALEIPVSEFKVRAIKTDRNGFALREILLRR